MQPLKPETDVQMDAAARLGTGGLARFFKERQYITRALLALMGELGEEMRLNEAGDQTAGHYFFPGSEVGFRFYPDRRLDRVARVDLLIGKARRKNERDVSYMRKGDGFNVPRIVDRLLEAHGRWAETTKQEAMIARHEERGKKAVNAACAGLGVTPKWEAPPKDPPKDRSRFRPYCRIRESEEAKRHAIVVVQATAEGFTLDVTVTRDGVDEGGLEDLLALMK